VKIYLLQYLGSSFENYFNDTPVCAIVANQYEISSLTFIRYINVFAYHMRNI